MRGSIVGRPPDDPGTASRTSDRLAAYERSNPSTNRPALLLRDPFDAAVGSLARRPPPRPLERDDLPVLEDFPTPHAARLPAQQSPSEALDPNRAHPAQPLGLVRTLRCVRKPEVGPEDPARQR